jgi:hypothetical protein
LQPKSKARNVLKGLLFALLLVAIPVALFFTGYFLKRESIEQPERELVVDLPLVENYERYAKVVVGEPRDGIEFLQNIYSKGLFSEVDDLFSVDSVEDSIADLETTSEPPSDDTIQNRNDRISRMTDQQREELFRKQEKFQALPIDQQNKLREFHELLSSHEDKDKLVEVLVSYFEWLKILGGGQQADVLDMPLNRRLEEIEKITSQQAAEFFGFIGSTKLPLEDAKYFYRWYVLSIRFHARKIRTRIESVLMDLSESEGLTPQGGVISRIKSGPIEQLVEFLIRRSPEDRDFIGRLLCRNTDQESIGIDYLRSVVSDESKAIIDSPDRSDRDRRELILKWIEAANQARFPIKMSSLKSFYRELPDEVRDGLNNLDPDNWHDELTRMYWKENIDDRADPAEEEAFEKLLQDSGWWNVFDPSEGS